MRNYKINFYELVKRIDPANFYADENLSITKFMSKWSNGGLCPFHDDTRPNSFFVNLSTGAYSCYSCGAYGTNVVSFYTARHGVTFKDALEDLNKRYEVAL